jgi:hypothetical protein
MARTWTNCPDGHGHPLTRVSGVSELRGLTVAVSLESKRKELGRDSTFPSRTDLFRCDAGAHSVQLPLNGVGQAADYGHYADTDGHIATIPLNDWGLTT